MTNPSSSRGRPRGCAAPCAPRSAAIAAGRAAPSSPSRTRPAHRRRHRCAPRWKLPSAAPTPTAPGTGRPPTTPARRRRSCSCANLAPPCARKAGVARRLAADAGQDRGPSPHPYAPLRGEPGAPAILDADRAGPRGRAAAAITPADLVLEPSAGTGLLAILAELAGGSLVLNELAETRAGLLGHLFPGIAVTRFDAAQIDDHLDAGDRAERRADEPALLGDGPCRSPHGRRRASPCRFGIGAARRWRAPRRHHRGELRAGQSGLARRLRPASGARPRRLLGRDRRRGLCQARHDHRHAADRDRQAPADDPGVFPASPGIAPDAATLLGWVTQHVPPRLAARRAPSPFPTSARPAMPRTVARHRACVRPPFRRCREPEAVELAYETFDWTPAGRRPDHRCAL